MFQAKFFSKIGVFNKLWLMTGSGALWMIAQESHKEV